MRIRDIIEAWSQPSPLVEAQPWAGFKGSTSSRVWFNTNTGEAITTNDDGNHSIGVSNNPEIFGLTPEDLVQAGLQSGEKAYDYDGRVLHAVMSKGWVRLFVDPRSPDTSSNIEGKNFRDIRRALSWYCDSVGTPMRIVLVIRTGMGDKDGTPYPLRDMEQVEWFLRHGSIKRDLVNPPDTVQVRAADTTPHLFRGV